jgi:MSHA biogenesis protein MshK
MDEVVITTTRMPASAVRRLAASLALLVAHGAGAQALQDPTKPPAAMAAPVEAGGGSVASGPQLQSILIGRAAGGRHVAVIDGETVRLGETFHGAKVARIGENEVVLVRGGERQVLRLYADAADGRDRLAGRNARR